MFVYRGVTKCNVYFERRFLTYRRARAFADAVLLRVMDYRIERRSPFAVIAPMVALVLALSVPAAAFAEEGEAQGGESAGSGVLIDAAEGTGNYVIVANEQVIGDFFFVLVADTVLLVLNLGALGFLCFKPVGVTRG